MLFHLPQHGWRIAVAGLLAAASLMAGCATAPAAEARRSTEDATAAPSLFMTSDAHRRAQARLRLATAYYEQGRLDIALEEVQQSLAHDPRDADAYSLLGLIRQRQGQPDEAQRSLRRALALRPGRGELLHNLGYVQCEAGQYADAQRQFALAVADPAYTEQEKTGAVSAWCHARAGDLAQAEAAWRQVLERDRSHAAANYELASLLHADGRSEQARAYLRRLNNSDQASAGSLALGVEVERALGHPDTAWQLAEQLRRRYPDSLELAAQARGGIEK
ncbi:MAG: Beta-barrel assembly-enhancing protease [Paracidovorax wautersii]|uniref:Beta-barrel assembly-enhancing protease n=1 Tax=Paracidovorax wautersii TaxID=1177982 RepID=A0A7V8JRJ8_9BURK|nr:MAG: Beta-barrel assembly-enhancing protease [Paracidovorax wautersii]